MVVAQIYTAAWCNSCTWAEEHLRARGVSLHEIDVEKLAEWMRPSEIPITHFTETNEYVLGFDRAKLDAAIRRAGGGVPWQHNAALMVGITGIAAAFYILWKKSS